MIAPERLLATLADAAAPFEARLAAGTELGHCGDPRVAEPDVVPIPTGDLKHKDSDEAEPDVRPIAAFGIDRYPVTVGAYARFLEQGGYDEPAFWSSVGWRWVRESALRAPRFWDEEEWAAYQVPNHPVVGVSVFEAEAYAAWAGARLPTADEWGRACRGDDARAFPWGESWRDDACCHRNAGPRSTVPVGLFPQGRSPFGVFDLVGSVWQWTADRAARPQGDVGRIVCGGAWNSLPWSIGCNRSNAYAPTARFSNLGFRCTYDLA